MGRPGQSNLGHRPGVLLRDLLDALDNLFIGVAQLLLKRRSFARLATHRLRPEWASQVAVEKGRVRYHADALVQTVREHFDFL